MEINIEYAKCDECKSYTCVDCCAMAVFSLQENRPIIVDLDSCTQCGICADLCPKNAIEIKE
jgi:NAD-dependent dihydropyrimidine dehydrogenase PreA subunit